MTLKIENLSFRFGNKWILRDVNFEALAGQVFGICGTVGSGKTSLLKAIVGELNLSSGAIYVESQNVTTLGTKRGFGLLTEEARSGFLSLVAISKQKGSRFESRLQKFEDFLKANSKIILLDDPFVGLDNITRGIFIEKLKGWLTPDRIAVFASSSFEHIASVSSNILIIDKGYPKQSGTPKDIYEKPESTAAALLTGDANLIRARRISSSDADLPEFQTLEGGHRILAQSTPKARLGPLNKDSILAIRPEQITMSMGASFPEDNLLRAIVTNIEFHGATSLIEFDAGGLCLKTRVFQVVSLEIGTECMLGLPPDRIVVLRD